ncbi:Crp/Fnr family transcriptional regulator [Sphingomonas glacialis]|uniref:Crp/Fnr family transcriptional regulator n=1 Tax=Sphingomonas glacialis TaxID=658225 RepID=A0A502FX70_9SPHN|nr:Crp/Fnr family transcriptional regulator [Sphingomonas glacialis]TPG54039.1 Crp/Fnr family transcriptional regulator [Sphingomonas glacialis]
MSAVCADCAVRDASLCSSLGDDALRQLHRIGRRQRVARGETMLWAGSDSLVCATLLSGVLKLSAATSDGREQIVGLHFPSDFIGRLYADTIPFTVSALTDAELCVVPRDRFEAMLTTNGEMERLLLKRTFATLDATRARLLILSRNTAAEKVAGFVLSMAERARGISDFQALPGGPVTFELPLTRGQIADVLGLTIETVSRQLTKLRHAGVLALPGVRSVTIRDAAALRHCAGLD